MRGWIIITIIVSTIMLSGLGGARLWDRDEPRNAQCAAEMFERGDLVVPTFAGQLRTHKPVLLYWLQMLAYALLGVNEFAARLPSALLGIATVWLTMSIASRLLNHQAARWAGIVLGSSLMFVLAARAATPDSVLIFCSTLAIATFVLQAYRRDESDGRLTFHWLNLRQWAFVYAACGFAVLAKGPIGLLLPGCVIGLQCIWEGWKPSLAGSESLLLNAMRASRQFVMLAFATAWKMRPLLAIATVFAIAAPWYIAVAIETDGVWVREFFWEHNVSRAISPMEGHSGPPLVFYVSALLIGTFPWSMFAIPIVLTARLAYRDCAMRPAIVLASIWVAVYVLFFSIAATKLPSYVTPCHPGVALVTGWFMAQLADGKAEFPRWLEAGFACGLIVGIGIAFALAGPVAEIVPTTKYLAIAGVFFAVASVLGVAFASRGRIDLGVRSFAVGAVLTVWTLFALGPRAADLGREEMDMLMTHFESQASHDLRSQPSDATQRSLVVGTAEPSWVFYAEGKIDEIATAGNPDWPLDVLSHLRRGDASSVIVRASDMDQLKTFVESQSRAYTIDELSRAGGAFAKDEIIVVRLAPMSVADAGNREGPL